MKSLFALLALTSLVILAGCDDSAGVVPDSYKKGSEAGQEAVEKDQESGNASMGATEAVID